MDNEFCLESGVAQRLPEFIKNLVMIFHKQTRCESQPCLLPILD